MGTREVGARGRMIPPVRWTNAGRWNEAGTSCYALLGSWQQAQWSDRLIWGAPVKVLTPKSAEDALRKVWASWA